MIALTPEARVRLESYLRQVEANVLGRSEDEVAAVVGEVREHIQSELESAEQPVTEKALELVLERLGSPRYWVNPEEAGGLRRLIGVLRHGPEDWRLAYLCLGLTVSVIGLPIAFVLGRGFLALLAERGEQAPAQRWLVMPALAICSLLIAVGLLAWPANAVLVVMTELSQLDASIQLPTGLAYWIELSARAGMALGAWWVLMGLVAAGKPGWVRSLFRPFADRFSRRAGLVFAMVGAALLAVALIAFAKREPLQVMLLNFWR